MKKFKDVSDDVKKILLEQFGIECDYRFYEGGKGKIYAVKEDAPDFLRRKVVHSGVYVGRIERDGFRLSLDGAALLGRYAKRCVVDVGDEVVERWMKGEDLEDLELESDCSYVILRWRGFYVGCGKVVDGKVKNYIPKNRRISVP